MRKNRTHRLFSRDRLARSGRLLILIMLAVACIGAGLLRPKDAQAAITAQQDWTNIYDATSYPSVAIPYTVNDGSGRLLVVAVSTSLNGNATSTASVSYGGQSLTKQITDETSSRRVHTWLFYLNEAGIQGALNTDLDVTINGGTSRVTYVFAAVFAGVNQSTPILDSQNYNNTNTTMNFSWSTNLDVDAGHQAVEVINATRTNSCTYRTISYNGNWNMIIEQSRCNTDGARTGMANRDIPGTDTTDNSSSSLNNSAYVSMTGMSIIPAPITTAPGTATASSPAGQGSRINVSMPYSDDGNGNNTYTVEYKLSSSGTWLPWVTNAAHTSSPYTTTITGLALSTNYDVRVTYNDADGISGGSPQIQTLTNITTASTENGTMTGTATATPAATSIAVSMPYTYDQNSNNTYTVDYRPTSSANWTNWVTSAAHSTSPYTTNITGLTASTEYQVRMTYNDADSVSGSNPQTVTVKTSSNVTTISGSFVVTGSSYIEVTAPYTDDGNGNNSVVISYRTPPGSGGYTPFCTLPHQASPYYCKITGLSTGTSYDVQITWTDSNGTSKGASPYNEVISNILVNNDMLHNSRTTGKYGINRNFWSGDGGWGLAGAKFGEFTCETCHTKTTTNIKRVKETITVPDTSKGNIPGSTVNFTSTTSATTGFGNDSSTHSTSEKVCEVCHSNSGLNYHKYNQAAVCHELPVASDCMGCHKHNKGFKPEGGCTTCHSQSVGSRVAVVGQFASNSHHIQGKNLSDADCYQCHWEANSDGSINGTYHEGCTNSGAPVDLVIYGTTTRPTAEPYTSGVTGIAYTASVQSRAELAKINSHCIGCHDNDSVTIQPFGDGKTPNWYAWDGTCSNTTYNYDRAGCLGASATWTAGTSVAARYGNTSTATWGKYTDSGTTDIASKALTKAYSAHGNAGNNARGFDDRAAPTGTGVDGTITNTSGGVSVLCFDCHNSHGSSVSGRTTSYTSATTNGGMLKDVTADKGGYSVTYKPQTSSGTATRAAHEAGGGLCFDCHLTATGGSTTPWGYNSTYGASQMIVGYWEKPGWNGAAGTNPAGPQLRYSYKNNIGTSGGHFGASSELTTSAMGVINGLCTPCHDPHGVSTAALGSNAQYGLPMLKGTWVTNPYKEDAAPLEMNLITGDSSRSNEGPPSPYSQRSTPGYHIDQNTFAWAATDWNWNTTTSHAQMSGTAATASVFGGLCLKCHPQSEINPNSSTTWKSMDRIHNTVRGWGGTGANANNAVHAFPCSKCHTPHSSCLPRLMVTNCVDYNHRGRVASGGQAGVFCWGSGGNPACAGSSTDGAGAGRYPSGGGGGGNSPNSNDGPYWFGNTKSSRDSTLPNLVNCHNVSGAGGTNFPDSQYWNSKTPW